MAHVNGWTWYMMNISINLDKLRRKIMIEEGLKLVKALTNLAAEGAIYFARLNGSELPFNNSLTASEVVAAVKKTRKSRKIGVGNAKAPEPSEPPKVNKTDDLTEAQSDEKLKKVATTFIKRSATKDDGVAAVRKMMTDDFSIARMSDLVHAQRLQLIVKLEGEIKAMDAETTVAA